MNELAVLSKAMIQERKDIILSILGGFIAGIAGVALFSASGYLISQTVFAPPLYTLIVLTSMVKLLGLLRAASRYGRPCILTGQHSPCLAVYVHPFLPSLFL